MTLSSATSVYSYDGDNLIEETNLSGGVVARYSQTQNLDEPLAMLRSAATSYYHADGLGSVTSLSNTAGALAQTYTFDSFGNTTNSTGSLTNFFRYTGREFDTETNLYFYRTRYYDPSFGRFMSEDSIGFKGGIDFYAYVNNRPVNSTDPTGLKSCGLIAPALPLCHPTAPNVTTMAARLIWVRARSVSANAREIALGLKKCAGAWDVRSKIRWTRQLAINCVTTPQAGRALRG